MYFPNKQAVADSWIAFNKCHIPFMYGMLFLCLNIYVLDFPPLKCYKDWLSFAFKCVCAVGALLNQETALDGILYSDSAMRVYLCPQFVKTCFRWTIAVLRSKCLNIFMFIFLYIWMLVGQRRASVDPLENLPRELACALCFLPDSCCDKVV